MVLALDLAQLLPQEVCRGSLGVDLILELGRVHLHEFMGITRITVFTSELAAPIGIDSPPERHIWLCSVQNAAGGDFEILDGSLGFEQLACGSQEGDANECHVFIFAFYSPFGNTDCAKVERTRSCSSGSPLCYWRLPVFFMRSMPIAISPENGFWPKAPVFRFRSK